MTEMQGGHNVYYILKLSSYYQQLSDVQHKFIFSNKTYLFTYSNLIFHILLKLDFMI